MNETSTKLARSLGARLRKLEAALLAVSALVAAICLPMPFHDYLTTDPNRAGPALYLGPDYHVSGAERARMLEPTVRHSHTGLEHQRSGVLVLAGALVVAALGLGLALARGRKLAPWAALVLGLGGMSLAGWIVLDALLVHLFQHVEPAKPAERVFEIALFAILGSSAVLMLHALGDLVRALVAWVKRRKAGAPPA